VDLILAQSVKGAEIHAKTDRNKIKGRVSSNITKPSS
jgi:hypothetical protein